MSRVALGIEYDGTGYHGWQTQPEVPAVANDAQKALSRVANHPIHLTAAGRTDAQVHACEQVVHFDTDANRPEKAWVRGANRYLPNSIRVHWARYVDDQFHARFSALSRTYHYLIINNPTNSALLNNLAAFWRQPLEVEYMRQAAQHLIGEHDFSSFQSSSCQSTTAIRRVDHIDCASYDKFIIVTVTANAFLHHMVRNIVGSLCLVGEQRRRLQWLAEVLQAKDRRVAGITAPAQGLYLSYVRYPENFNLPRTEYRQPFKRMFDNLIK